MSNSALKRSIGLLSAASGDGVIAALLDTDGRDEIHPLGGVAIPYEGTVRWRVLEATQNDLPTTEILRLEREITEHHAAVVDLLRSQYPQEVAAAEVIGFSGHTIRHIPSESLTLQIGNPWLLAELTKLPVVADFRRHDMSIGGQGAPLIAMFHWALMASEPRPALMLDLSQVASVTWLSRRNEIIAGDTGPGVGLLNEWVQELADQAHDLNGALSKRGTIDEEILRSALDAPFFYRSLPKAADRNDFDHIDVSGLKVESGAATLCAVTVAAFLQAARQLPELPKLLWVTGVGSRQPTMLRLLREHFETVKNVAERGLNPGTLEAESYAWLAVRHLRGLPITTPETTGCRQADSAGFNTLAPRRTTTDPDSVGR
ncbi:MAG: anhydro-N-acetylmuramic acid kinase [Pirellulales bacterium]